MRRIPCLAPLALATLLPLTASAQPVPVLSVSVRDRAPSPDLVARAASVTGADAQHGAALSATLTERFGRFAPPDDALRAQRQEALSAIDAYFASASRARRRIEPAARALEQSRDALELREENRAVYLRALMMIGRIELEAQHPEAADPWFRRAIEFEPSWTPGGDWPPAVVQRHRELRGAAVAPVALTVRTPREGCSVTVDGAAVPGAAREREVSVRPGAHRVAAACDRPSRVRTVTVSAPVTVSIDPRLDAALQLTGAASLTYATEGDASRLVDDVAAVGEALGARRVVAVDASGARVVDVPSRSVRATLSNSASDFEARLDAALSDAPSTAAVVASVTPPREAPVTTVERGAGPWPWVLVGAGGAAVAAGAVLLVLRNGEFDRAVERCPTSASGAYQCGPLDDAQRIEARSHYDTAGTYDAAGWAAVGVGGAAIVGGVLWRVLGSPPRSERSAFEAPSLRGAFTPGGASVQVDGRF